MFKAGLGKPLETVLRENTVFLGTRALWYAFAKSNKQSRLLEGEKVAYFKFFFNEQKKILWVRNIAP